MDDNTDLPADYEECGECGYDHAYEPHEAYYAHQMLEYAHWAEGKPELNEEV